MTKSTITRERLQEIAEDGFLKHGESKELARMALAAMDSEPVEESVTCWSCRNEVEISAIGDRDGYCPICDAPIDLDEEPYNSPQPAPVAPEEMPCGGAANDYHDGYQDGWNACRAAMLQAEPVCTCPSGDGSLRWPCPVHPGNSPVIPDGYVIVPKEPTEKMVVEGFESWPDEFFSDAEVWEAYQEMSGCEQAAHRAKLCWAAMLAAVPPAPTQENI